MTDKKKTGAPHVDDIKKLKEGVDYMVDANGMYRTTRGHLLKGQVLNKKGAPKKEEKNTEIKAGELSGKPMEDLLYLLKTATSRAEVFKIAKELMPYVTPKLSSVQSEVRQEKEVVIRIEGFDPLKLENNEGNMVDITPNIAEFTMEELEDLKETKLKEFKKDKK